jgi:Ni,Fe-hydrogenase III small subunit
MNFVMELPMKKMYFVKRMALQLKMTDFLIVVGVMIASERENASKQYETTTSHPASPFHLYRDNLHS